MAFQYGFSQKVFACLISGSFLLLTPLSVEASSLGAGWEPKPLVNPNAEVEKPSEAEALQTQTPEAGGIPQVNLEEALKPALPFIESVEQRLFIKPDEGQSLSDRLNNLQQLLYGEQKYQDAGPLLANMAELFPEDAAEAQQQLQRQMLEQQSALAATTDKGTSKAKNSKKARRQAGRPTVQQPAQPMPAQTAYADPMAQQHYQGMPQQAQQQHWNGQQPMPQPQQQAAASPFPERYKMLNRQHGFGGGFDSAWDDDFDSGWDDDFGNSQHQAQAHSAGAGSKARAIGQGLLGLAGVAGALAGGYFLNRQMGGGNPMGNPMMGNPMMGMGHPNMMMGNPMMGVPMHGGFGNPMMGVPVHGGFGNPMMGVPVHGGFGNPMMGNNTMMNPYGMRGMGTRIHTRPFMGSGAPGMGMTTGRMGMGGIGTRGMMMPF